MVGSNLIRSSDIVPQGAPEKAKDVAIAEPLDDRYP